MRGTGDVEDRIPLRRCNLPSVEQDEKAAVGEEHVQGSADDAASIGQPHAELIRANMIQPR